jgi:hypothetical protein
MKSLAFFVMLTVSCAPFVGTTSADAANPSRLLKVLRPATLTMGSEMSMPSLTSPTQRQSQSATTASNVLKRRERTNADMTGKIK